MALRRAQMLVLAILFSVLGYGFWRIVSAPAFPRIGVGVVQPNVPQHLKWDPKVQTSIVFKTIDLSRQLRSFHPDLIIWPETSLPAATREAPYLIGAIRMEATQLQIPLLFGAITDEDNHYYNSAYLISDRGAIAGRYDKIHLVPFGEYMPLRPVLGWINKYIGLEDFTSGRDYTLFNVSGRPFGILICFEDTLQYLWVNFINQGAGFLVNMTNDAWFMDTKAPFMHLQAAVFGSVANKRSLVRAANTGFSGFVDPFGRILGSVSDAKHKKTFIEGTAFSQVPVVYSKTFYTKFGDVFTAGCFLVILWGLRVRRIYV
jgi:apolipoprotein N-acyltransferase